MPLFVAWPNDDYECSMVYTLSKLTAVGEHWHVRESMYGNIEQASECAIVGFDIDNMD